MALETEIEKTNLAGKSIMIEMDANAKMGKQYIPKDPHDISPNGTMLASIVERQHLLVGNGQNICTGTITRTRTARNRIENSVIDIVLFSKDLMTNLVSLKIDENRDHVLTKVTNTKNGPKLKESDHNPIITQFNLSLKDDNHEDKLEVFNLKNQDCQKEVQGIYFKY